MKISFVLGSVSCGGLALLCLWATEYMVMSNAEESRLYLYMTLGITMCLTMFVLSFKRVGE